jgi:hypothetical protein
MIGAYMAGGVTGAHMNPAVTLAMALRGKTSWIKVCDCRWAWLECEACMHRWALALALAIHISCAQWTLCTWPIWQRFGNIFWWAPMEGRLYCNWPVVPCQTIGMQLVLIIIMLAEEFSKPICKSWDITRAILALHFALVHLYLGRCTRREEAINNIMYPAVAEKKYEICAMSCCVSWLRRSAHPLWSLSWSLSHQCSSSAYLLHAWPAVSVHSSHTHSFSAWVCAHTRH